MKQQMNEKYSKGKLTNRKDRKQNDRNKRTIK